MTSTTAPSNSPSPADSTHSTTDNLIRRSRLRLAIGAGLALLVVLAVGVRLITFERYLPVLDHIDEIYRFINSYQVRPDAPLGDQYGEVAWSEGFPPVHVWLSVWTQRAVERVVAFPFPPDYVRALRAISAALNVGTVVLLALTGWLLGRRLGTVGAALSGFFSAVVWAVAPRVVGTGNLALMDPIIFPLVAAALFFAVYAIQEDAAWASVVSLIAVIAAIYTKYLLVYALWMPFCAVAVLTWRQRWQMLPWIGGMAVLSALTAGWLVFVHRALELGNREATIFYENGLANALSVSRNLDNLAYTLEETVGVGLFVAVMVLTVGADIWRRRQGWDALNWRWLAMLLPYMLGCLLLTSSVDVLREWHQGWYRVRYTLPMALGLLLMWGVGVATITDTLARITRRGWWVFPAAVATVVIAPSVWTNVRLAQAYQQTHTYEKVWDWSSSTLTQPEGKIITAAESFLGDAWNRPWSGYNRAVSQEWVFDENPALQPPAYFWERGITYFGATDEDLNGVYDTPTMSAWIDELFLLKTIKPAAIEPRTSYIYRLRPPQVTTGAIYGDTIELVGYDWSGGTAAPGEVITLTPFWQATETPDANYNLFAHLLPLDEVQPVAQFDGSPAADGRPTVTWTDAGEVLPGNTVQVTVPGDLPPGDYRLALGLYDYTTGQRLQLADGSDFHTVPVAVE